MAKRVTIKNDPLGDLDLAERPDHPAATNPDAEPSTRGTADQSKETPKKRKTAARASVREAADGRKEEVHRAVGGRLELLGGSFGTGVASIKRFGDNGRIGFMSPAEEHVDLESEVEDVTSSHDREEHRLLSATGWAWAAGAIIGPLGIVLGGGIRLLHPKRMLLNMRLRDGRILVARTDAVTCGALQALTDPAKNRSAAG